MGLHPMYDSLLSGLESSDPSDTDWAIGINKKITWYAIGFVSTIGVPLNCFLIWVWSVKPGFDPLVFLFKALAVFDIMYIIGFNMWYHAPSPSTTKLVLEGVAVGSQYMLVDITLVLTTCRWLVMLHPLRSRPLLSRFRMSCAVVVVITVSIVCKLSELMVNWYYYDTKVSLIVSVVFANLLLGLPMLLEAILTFSLVWMSYQRYIRCRRLTLEGTAQTDGQEKYSCQDAVRGKKRFNKKLFTARRMTMAIIAINTLSLIAYPIGVALLAYFKLSSYRHVKTSNKRIIFAVVNLLQIINSSFNFFIYLIFIQKFRKLCHLRLMAFFTDNYFSLGSLSIEERSDFGIVSIPSHLHSTVTPYSSRDVLRKKRSSAEEQMMPNQSAGPADLTIITESAPKDEDPQYLHFRSGSAIDREHVGESAPNPTDAMHTPDEQRAGKEE